MENNDQILDEFLIEAQEIFDQLDRDFVRLEQTPQDKKLLGSFFRAMHTLKGGSGFLSLRRLEKVAHAGESLLSKVRDGVLAINQDNTTALLKTLDRLREIVGGVADTRAEPEGDDTELLVLLRAMTAGEAAPLAGAAPEVPPPPPPPPPPRAAVSGEAVAPAEGARDVGADVHNEQILEEFLVEAQEIFDRLDLDFVQLEQTPEDKKLLRSIFRAMHTLKGSSGFFSFRRLEAVAHAGESLLSRVRDGEIAINEDNTNALLQTLDCLRDIVAGVAQTRQEPAGDDTALIAVLRAMTLGQETARGALERPAAAALSPASGAAPSPSVSPQPEAALPAASPAAGQARPVVPSHAKPPRRPR